MILYFSEKALFIISLLCLFRLFLYRLFLSVSCFRFHLFAGKSNPDHVAELHILHLRFTIRSGFKIHCLEVCVTLTIVFFIPNRYMFE